MKVEDFQGLDPVIRLNSKYKIPLPKANNMHPVFRIAGILSQEGMGLDHALHLRPDRPLVRSGNAWNSPMIKPSPTIIQVGCGGTGSHLLPNILQYACSAAKKDKIRPPEVVVIDGDTVEDKNLVRQRFSSTDLGSNKAEALARRYSSVFEIKIKAYGQFLRTASELSKLIDTHVLSSGPIILLGAVDNHRARAIIWEAFHSVKNREVWWVDAGNEAMHGQVVAACRNVKTRGQTPWNQAKIGSSIFPVELPTFFDVFPEEFLIIGGTPEVPQNDCARVAEADPQTIQANMMSAQCATNMLIQILEGDVQTMSMNFDAKIGQIKAQVLTRVNLAQAFNEMKASRARIADFLEGLGGLGQKSDVQKMFPGFFGTRTMDAKEFIIQGE